MAPLRIMLVDDHEIVRVGLAALLARYSRFEVVAEAAQADEAVRKAASCRPDLVLMDIRLPGRSGIQATREIVKHHPETRVIILTSYADDDLLVDAIAAGASGYVLKQIGSDALVQALDAVQRGESLLDPRLTGKVFARLRELAREERGQAFRDLTKQEMAVLRLVAEGLTNREIAERVFLAEKTVRNHVSSVLGKLGLTSRAQAAAFAVEHGLLSSPSQEL